MVRGSFQIYNGKRWGRRPLAWPTPCQVSTKQGEVTSRGFRTSRARNRRNRLLGSYSITIEIHKEQNFPVLKARFRSLVMFTPTTKDPGRGGGDDSPAVRGKCRVATKGDGPRAGRPERSPAGDFQGDSSPLEWSFASFSSNKKRKGRQGFGGAA